MPVTDAQVHLFPPNTPEHPWPSGEGRSAPPRASWSAEEMLASMDAIGVDRAVIVPPVWAGDNNDYALEAAARYPARFAVMSRFDPFAIGAPERLESWLSQPHMLGIRMSGRWQSSPVQFLDALQDGSLDWYFAACERLGIPLMVLTMGSLPRIRPVAERHPGLTLIIDHMSTAGGPAVADAFAMIDELVGLAKYPRVAVKVSTGPNRSQQAYPFLDVHPYIRRIYDAFGSRRMLWAADITQLTKNTYAECLRLFTEGLPFLSATDKDWILAKTAAELLKWPEAAA